MKFKVDDLEVYFPYDYIYPEQYEYMKHLYRAIKNKGHALLEMPCGTGKTITLLSLITSYQQATNNEHKLIYCTRTVAEAEKVLHELKRFIHFKRKSYPETIKSFLAIGLSSRKNLCINQKVLEGSHGIQIDSQCRSKTAGWIRDRKLNNGTFVLEDIEDIELCEYYENLEREEEDQESLDQESVTIHSDKTLPAGIYDLNDLKKYGKEKGFCPYFAARRALEHANIIVYSYSYLLDPKIASMVSAELGKSSIVVFDEAHNIDSVCIESLSINMTTKTLDQIDANIERLENRYEAYKRKNAERLQAEYQRLVNGLASEGIGQRDGRVIANPVLPKDILQEPVPGNIRRVEFFFIFLKRLSLFIRQDMNPKALGVGSGREDQPRNWLKRLEETVFVTPHQLKFTAERLYSLLTTLEVPYFHEYVHVSLLGDLATMLGTYDKGFTIIVEKSDYRTHQIDEPKFQFACLDASIAIRNVFEKFQSVILTSGTLSPLNFYRKLLDFRPIVAESFQNTLMRQCICPLFISRGSDQAVISTKFEKRKDPSVMNNFGRLLEELSKYVPDGIVCFFPSYAYMEQVMSYWYDNELFSKISENKLIFVETPDLTETSIALTNYRRACDSGRGAIFISYARGKVSEGIDFEGHYGRCAVMIGVPMINNQSMVFQSRAAFLKTNKNISDSDFLNFDSMRNASQCLGRVIRHKNDYGIMVLCDDRYRQPSKYKKLPRWIQSHITPSRMKLTTALAVGKARAYFVEMAQKPLPEVEKQQIRRILLSEEDILQREEVSHARDAGHTVPMRRVKREEDEDLDTRPTKELKISFTSL